MRNPLDKDLWVGLILVSLMLAYQALEAYLK